MFASITGTSPSASWRCCTPRCPRFSSRRPSRSRTPTSTSGPRTSRRPAREKPSTRTRCQRWNRSSNAQEGQGAGQGLGPARVSAPSRRARTAPARLRHCSGARTGGSPGCRGPALAGDSSAAGANAARPARRGPPGGRRRRWPRGTRGGRSTWRVRGIIAPMPAGASRDRRCLEALGFTEPPGGRPRGVAQPGVNHSTDSGGSVSAAEASCPSHPYGSVWMRPRLPMPEPP